ncbi:MAG TPA: glutamine--fructose-6-phosphate transaminase (isomerizing) [Actinomycetota bacterium]|nr:glutamine--fructose-6-phosphate transaminase (isomerizing) [Actinomycetota bacterium]
MCGIVGYVGDRSALPVLLEGLKSLEYRGYDSAGIAMPARNGAPGLEVVRRAGRVDELVAAAQARELAATAANGQHAGIGHTRWATCGEPSEGNAHPHRDCTGNLAIVHNGIIENHLQLRQQLVAAGHTFSSATDSEVVAHLVEERLTAGADLLEAVRTAVGALHGSFAIVAIDARYPGVIVGARVDAPLVLGLGEGECFFASDVAPLLRYTRQVVWLADGEIAQLSRAGARIIGLDGAEHVPTSTEVAWDREAAEKAGFPDFMLKEIYEQPRTLRDTLRSRAEPSGELTLTELAISPAELAEVNKIFIVACGSSYHAGLVAKYAFERWARIPVEIDVASEFRYRDPVLDAKTLVVGISQSGETADTLAAIRYARTQGARTIVITNVVGSSLSREADAVLYTHAGPEIGVAATKTLSTQIAALWLLGLWFAEGTGAMEREAAAEVIRELWRCPELMEAFLDGPEGPAAIAGIAERFATAPGWLFIGRGVGFPLALEGALKLKEISYLHAEGFAAGEMKHGPIALIDKGTPVVAIATHSRVLGKLISNVEEARARGASVVAIAQQGDERVLEVAADVVAVPETAELLSPMLDLLPLQLLAYHVAKLRGCDPDRPRNLAKSVTVE